MERHERRRVVGGTVATVHPVPRSASADLDDPLIDRLLHGIPHDLASPSHDAGSSALDKTASSIDHPRVVDRRRHATSAPKGASSGVPPGRHARIGVSGTSGRRRRARPSAGAANHDGSSRRAICSTISASLVKASHDVRGNVDKRTDLHQRGRRRAQPDHPDGDRRVHDPKGAGSNPVRHHRSKHSLPRGLPRGGLARCS